MINSKPLTIIALVVAAIACFWFFDNIVNAILTIFGLSAAASAPKIREKVAEAKIHDDTRVRIDEEAVNQLIEDDRLEREKQELADAMETTAPREGYERKKWSIRG